MDKEKIKKIRKMLDGVLKAASKKFAGIKVHAEQKNGSYNNSSFTVKVEFADVSADGTVETKERNDYRLCARMFNLKQEWLDQEFTDRKGKVYTVTGLKPNATKRPVICRNIDTEGEYVFPAVAVRKAFEEKEGSKPAQVKKPTKTSKKEEPKKEKSVEDLINNAMAGV